MAGFCLAASLLPLQAANTQPAINLVSGVNAGSVIATGIPGTLTLAPSPVPAGLRTAFSGTFLGGSSAFALAAFTVTGTAGHSYTMSHANGSSTFTLTRAGGGSMTVAYASVLFTNNATTLTDTLPGSPSLATGPTLYAGLTVQVPASAPAGIYNGSFSLTVTDNNNVVRRTNTLSLPATLKVDPTPITLVKTRDLDFGAVIASNTAGTVELSPGGARTPHGGTILSGALAWSAGGFTVGGVRGALYSVALPTAGVSLTSGTSSMSLDNFTCSPAGQSALDLNGAGTVCLGATLYVGANQPPGAYANASLITVTVAYN